jgi:hypothetical protein
MAPQMQRYASNPLCYRRRVSKTKENLRRHIIFRNVRSTINYPLSIIHNFWGGDSGEGD